MRAKHLSLLGALLSASIIVATCGVLDVEAKGRVNGRQGNQGQRIGQGVKNGELTKREAHNLSQNQRKINRTETRFKSDGELSKGEKIKLENMQDRQSKAIYKQKHDGQDRTPHVENGHPTGVGHVKDPIGSVNGRQNKQENRIEQGSTTGSLTEKESAKLNKRQDRIDKVEEKFRADGELSPKERLKLDQMQDRQNKSIYHEKHDKQTTTGSTGTTTTP